MDLKKARDSARKELNELYTDGFRVLEILRCPANAVDRGLRQSEMGLWKAKVINALNGVFPTVAESHTFRNAPLRSLPHPRVHLNWMVDMEYEQLGLLDALQQIIRDDLSAYNEPSPVSPDEGAPIGRATLSSTLALAGEAMTSYDQSDHTKRIFLNAFRAASSAYAGDIQVRGGWRELFDSDAWFLAVLHNGVKKRLEVSHEYLSDRRTEQEITQHAKEALERLMQPTVAFVTVYTSGLQAHDESGNRTEEAKPFPTLTREPQRNVITHSYHSPSIQSTDAHVETSAVVQQHPTAFISYAWEGEDHKSWVRQLASQLRDHGVDVELDQWAAAPGDQLPEFMERAIRANTFVLIICTPAYKDKSDERKGGVGYEGDIMTAEVFTRRNHRKFIPILRRGEWREAAPSWLSGSYYVDLRGEQDSEAQYKDLLNTLHGRRMEAPPLGAPPPPGPVSPRTAIQGNGVNIGQAHPTDPQRAQAGLKCLVELRDQGKSLANSIGYESGDELEDWSQEVRECLCELFGATSGQVRRFDACARSANSHDEWVSVKPLEMFDRISILNGCMAPLRLASKL